MVRPHGAVWRTVRRSSCVSMWRSRMAASGVVELPVVVLCDITMQGARFVFGLGRSRPGSVLRVGLAPRARRHRPRSRPIRVPRPPPLLCLVAAGRRRPTGCATTATSRAATRVVKRLVRGLSDGEPACRRGSVHRPVARVRMGGHPSVRPTWGHRPGQPSHAWPCSGWGLPSRPGRPGRWCALTAPFHPCLCRLPGHRRSAFCCTVLRVAPTGR